MNKQIIKKHKILSFVILVVSLCLNVLRFYLTFNYEERPVYKWQQFVFIGLRILSLIFRFGSKCKQENAQKVPYSCASVCLISDILTWVFTSGQMLVLILRLLKDMMT